MASNIKVGPRTKDVSINVPEILENGIFNHKIDQPKNEYDEDIEEESDSKESFIKALKALKEKKFEIKAALSKYMGDSQMLSIKDFPSILSVVGEICHIDLSQHTNTRLPERFIFHRESFRTKPL